MDPLGRHILAEFYECDTTTLNSKAGIETLLITAAERAGATVVESVFHLFNPHGISGVVVIAESHLTIHTWPEYGYAAVDMFTCGESVDSETAIRWLKEGLGSRRVQTQEIPRGVGLTPN